VPNRNATILFILVPFVLLKDFIFFTDQLSVLQVTKDNEKLKSFPYLIKKAPRHKDLLGEWTYSSTNLNLSTKQRLMVRLTFLLFHLQVKSLGHPLYMGLGEPENRSCSCGEEKISFSAWEWNPNSSVVQPLTPHTRTNRKYTCNYTNRTNVSKAITFLGTPVY
jgi:hypothetical protein